jgi:hypothetical protein
MALCLVKVTRTSVYAREDGGGESEGKRADDDGNMKE